MSFSDDNRKTVRRLTDGTIGKECARSLYGLGWNPSLRRVITELYVRDKFETNSNKTLPQRGIAKWTLLIEIIASQDCPPADERDTSVRINERTERIDLKCFQRNVRSNLQKSNLGKITPIVRRSGRTFLPQNVIKRTKGGSWHLR